MDIARNRMENEAPEPPERRESPKVSSASPEPIVRFDSVSKSFSEDDRNALEGVNISIFGDEFVSLVGASGAGKSTLLKLIYAEESPTEGSVFFNGRDLSVIKRKHLPYYRRNIGTVFQDFKLLPRKTAFENVAYALEVYGAPTEEILGKVPQILDLVGLEGKEGRFPMQLSGGEQQRVAIARAIILQPKMIIADEPTGNLDPVSAEGIVDLLSEINRLGTTVILATHNQALVDRMGRRVIALDGGRVVSDERQGRYFMPERKPSRGVV